ncbi:helix-turn-helix domain-containing protein [Clostridium ljungdahlii]|uniref:Phage-related protein n=1 Tax=Clostridium ljungdahlii (strain ATCC 55383 / DSM 13528 / PETC) TaxID=748727 RepID=D8GU56_CLOLD|nr:helix-turn-helix domain-containing protein [Clostridium ljungdahlii]ADK14719.1 phage-related protein [Clostridium ljungdahlii DSM 13528]OAA84075.1 hypothetical protein WX45_01919 [Clostridium ljungdahlii DSM 13528]
MQGYTIISNNIITSNISNNAYRVYSALLSMAYGEKDYCYPSECYLANMLHKSIRTIQRGLYELKEQGLIVIKRRGSISNLYKIIGKKITKKVEEVAKKVKNTKKSFYSSKKKSAFNSFPQRKYDFKELEQQLLSGNYDSEKLIE